MYFLQRSRYKLVFGLDSKQQRKRTRIIIQLVIVILVFQRGCTGLTSLSFETMRMTHIGPCRPCPAYGSAIVFEKKVGTKVWTLTNNSGSWFFSSWSSRAATACTNWRVCLDVQRVILWECGGLSGGRGGGLGGGGGCAKEWEGYKDYQHAFCDWL